MQNFIIMDTSCGDETVPRRREGNESPGAVQRPVQEQEKKVTKGDRNQSLHNYLISE